MKILSNSITKKKQFAFEPSEYPENSLNSFNSEDIFARIRAGY